jgi:hypothetical protein
MTSTTGVRYFTSIDDQGGYSVSGGVDLNRDGFDDIIIGVRKANNNHGAAHVVFGSASPMDSSVFHLGNGVISLNGTLNSFFGYAVILEENVGTNSRGFLVTANSGVNNPVYYFHDLFGPPPSVPPTTAPTLSPTFPPTDAPTCSPSANPSVFPTIEPSVSPTFTPTWVPSVVPSENPTVAPSQIPTLIPSVIATMTPTTVPTIVPSFRSNTPTCNPSTFPTHGPSVLLTFDPTTSPSEVPSIRPSAPSFSPSVVPTPIPIGRSKSAIVISAGFTMNSVNGATLTASSQETIKQSIANASQTTVNNVELVSVTRTNRRLLLSSSVVHRMLATVSLFNYKVVAAIHFNLIDFPGLNESYVAGTKSKVLMHSMESHAFDRIISYYAATNNATQLMNNATVSSVTVITSIIPTPDDAGSKADLTVGEIVGIVVGAVAGACLLTGLIYLAVVQSRSEARRSIPVVESLKK